MKKSIMLLKPFSFLPALFMMSLIFSFSAQTGTESGSLSHEISLKIVSFGNHLLCQDLTEAETEAYASNLDYPIRKLAHMTEYFIFAVSVAFPLYVYGLRGFPLFLTVGIFCIGFAATDEYHQSFVAGRGPSVKDVGIDGIGVLAALILLHLKNMKR